MARAYFFISGVAATVVLSKTEKPRAFVSWEPGCTRGALGALLVICFPEDLYSHKGLALSYDVVVHGKRS